jgi:stage V sporulation protein G
MQITDVRVRKVSKEGKMKAVVSITLDNEFVVHDIKVIEGDKGLFIAMPSRKAGDGEYRDIAHPINSDTRDKIQKIILEKYEIAALEVFFSNFLEGDINLKSVIFPPLKINSMLLRHVLPIYNIKIVLLK